MRVVYRDDGNAMLPMLQWLGVEVFMPLAPARSLIASHRGCQFLSSNLRFMLSCVWFQV
jgi:hypothetical protein